MKTSTAEKHGFRCPACGDELTRDIAARGFVGHVRISKCDYGRGARDIQIKPKRKR